MDKTSIIANGGRALPTNVKPTQYDIKLELNSDQTYHGVVSILVDVIENSTSISLNTPADAMDSTITSGSTHVG